MCWNVLFFFVKEAVGKEQQILFLKTSSLLREEFIQLLSLVSVHPWFFLIVHEHVRYYVICYKILLSSWQVLCL